jgi:hypothetical protein
VKKKNSKYLAVLSAMLVFSILLASCQSMFATTEETDIKQAEEAWGANLTAQGESYFKSSLEEMEQASVPLIELRSDVPFESEDMKQSSIPWIELRSDVPFDSENLKQSSIPWIELRSDVPFDSENLKQSSIPWIELRSDVPFESEEMKQSSIPWIELRSDVPFDSEDMKQSSIPWIELRSDVPFEPEEMKQSSIPWIELRSDVPFDSEDMKQSSAALHGESYFKSYLEDLEQSGVPVNELRADVSTEAEAIVGSYLPGIEIAQTRKSRTIETVYTVTSNGPGWVVFHADEDGLPGAILERIWVSSGINRIAKTELLDVMSSELIHVMLHYDFARIGMFEFPGPDGPTLVNNEMLTELCLCSY